MKNAKKNKIMLVEDSQNLRAVLKDYFEMMNYDVIDFGDGESAIKSYKNGCCDICLLNIGLPKKDGYAVFDKLRNVTPELPIIFVTGKDTKEDRLKGVKAGCDDYVTKPFSTEELLLRTEAVLRRRGAEVQKKILHKESVFLLGDIVFNDNELQLTKGERVCLLARKEAKVLKLLYDYKNKLVPREIITKEIWGDSKAASGRSLDVFLSKIRKHLKSLEEDIPQSLHTDGSIENCIQPSVTKVEIVNVHGAGYLLAIRT